MDMSRQLKHQDHAFWAQLETQCQVKTNKSAKARAEVKRLNALEWLRLESLALAELNATAREHYRTDLDTVARRAHDYLLELRPRPTNAVAISALPTYAKHGLAAFVVDPQKPIHIPGRLMVSIDPSIPIKVIASSIKQLLPMNGRAAGAGRPRSIARMAEALRLHAERKRNQQTWRDLAAKAETFDPIPAKLQGTARQWDILEDRGQKLADLVNEMLSTAQRGSTAWFAAFPPR